MLIFERLYTLLSYVEEQFKGLGKSPYANISIHEDGFNFTIEVEEYTSRNKRHETHTVANIGGFLTLESVEDHILANYTPFEF